MSKSKDLDLLKSLSQEQWPHLTEFDNKFESLIDYFCILGYDTT
jgi:hypothetical protein